MQLTRFVEALSPWALKVIKLSRHSFLDKFLEILALIPLQINAQKLRVVALSYGEECPSGRRSTIGNRVCVNTASWVRIPPPPIALMKLGLQL